MVLMCLPTSATLGKTLMRLSRGVTWHMTRRSSWVRAERSMRSMAGQARGLRVEHAIGAHCAAPCSQRQPGT
jgi:hypothetical protein